MPSVLVGNRDGLLWFGADGRRGETAHSGRRVSAVAPERDALWAIVDESEVWQSADRTAWTPAGDLGAVGPLRARCVAATDAGVFVGSSEARLFRVAPDGGGLEPVDGFDVADGRSSWYT